MGRERISSLGGQIEHVRPQFTKGNSLLGQEGREREGGRDGKRGKGTEGRRISMAGEDLARPRV